MNDNDWLFLKILSEEKNITKAAKKLYVSQPALTEKIKKIEKQFKIQLIIRHPRGIEFTPEGEIIVDYAKRSLDELRKTYDLLSSMEKEVSGNLRIACSNVFAKYHLPQLLSKFHEAYPKAEIHFMSGYSQNLYQQFLSGNAQLAIVRGDHLWNEGKHLLWQEPLCLFSAEPVDLKNLPSLPYIRYNTDPPLQAIYDDWWYNHFTVKPNTVTEVDALDTCMKLVSYKLGYTLLSESCGIDMPQLYKYPLTTQKGDIIYRKTWLYHRHNYQNISVVKAFIDLLLASYPPIG